MSELERSGTRNPALQRMESRSAAQGRQLAGRASRLEASPLADGVLLVDLELTTTAEKFEHNLDGPWEGALIVKRSGPGELLMTSTQNDEKWIGLALSVGTATVSVAVLGRSKLDPARGL